MIGLWRSDLKLLPRKGNFHLSDLEPVLPLLTDGVEVTKAVGYAVFSQGPTRRKWPNLP